MGKARLGWLVLRDLYRRGERVGKGPATVVRGVICSAGRWRLDRRRFRLDLGSPPTTGFFFFFGVLIESHVRQV